MGIWGKLWVSRDAGQVACIWKHMQENNCDGSSQTIPGSIPGSCIPVFSQVATRPESSKIWKLQVFLYNISKVWKTAWKIEFISKTVCKLCTSALLTLNIPCFTCYRLKGEGVEGGGSCLNCVKANLAMHVNC